MRDGGPGEEADASETIGGSPAAAAMVGSSPMPGSMALAALVVVPSCFKCGVVACSAWAGETSPEPMGVQGASPPPRPSSRNPFSDVCAPQWQSRASRSGATGGVARLAPALSSRRMTPTCLLLPRHRAATASISAVPPLLFSRSMTAPWLISSSTSRSCPAWLANMSSVVPRIEPSGSSKVASTCPPAASHALMEPRSSCTAAATSARGRALACMYSEITFAHLVCELVCAIRRAAALGAAPDSSSRRTIMSWPALAASIRAVPPALVLQLSEAPLSIRSSTIRI